jgi:hypothetical protein
VRLDTAELEQIYASERREAAGLQTNLRLARTERARPRTWMSRARSRLGNIRHRGG